MIERGREVEEVLGALGEIIKVKVESSLFYQRAGAEYESTSDEKRTGSKGLEVKSAESDLDDSDNKRRDVISILYLPSHMA